MIATLLFSVLTLVPSAQAAQNFEPARSGSSAISPEQAAIEAARVREFVLQVEIDRNGRSTAAVSESPSPILNPTPGPRGWRAYKYRGFGILVNPASGLVSGFGGRANHDLNRPKSVGFDEAGRERPVRAPRTVSDDEARTLVARYYKATGRPYGVRVYAIDDGAGGNGTSLAINFLPTFKGIPYGDSYLGYMEIDRETGELDDLMLYREPPAPPANLVPKVSAAEAHLIAMRAAANAGRIVWDYSVPHNLLSIALLDRVPNPATTYRFTSADIADAAAERSRLVYDVRVEGVGGASYIALVDALDGRLLQVRRELLAVQGGGPTSTSMPRLSLLPDPRPWRVAEADGPWSTPVMSALKTSPSPAQGFHGARRLLLTDGRSAFQALYDPQTDMIGIEGDDQKLSIYRPGAALAELLRRKTG